MRTRACCTQGFLFLTTHPAGRRRDGNDDRWNDHWSVLTSYAEVTKLAMPCLSSRINDNITIAPSFTGQQIVLLYGQGSAGVTNRAACCAADSTRKSAAGRRDYGGITSTATDCRGKGRGRIVAPLEDVMMWVVLVVLNYLRPSPPLKSARVPESVTDIAPETSSTS